MTYQQALDFLYSRLPMFQRVGAAAYKADLKNTILLCKFLGNPERRFKSIHIAGTNGKGSSSHLLAAVLQEAGYRTGLYTSPHLKSFTERIRINGNPISEAAVVSFVERCKSVMEEISPSFFEATVGMAFDYFANEKVDIAVIETGLGGRLDSTNVILPELSLITNIGWDHADLLGDSLVKIAGEKAGIIKAKTPVVVSVHHQDKEIDHVFIQKAALENAPIIFAQDEIRIKILEQSLTKVTYQITDSSEVWFDPIQSDLPGNYQQLNIPGVMQSIKILRNSGWKISDEAIREGFANCRKLTGFKGRFQLLGERPTKICDTAHNEDGLKMVFKQIMKQQFEKLWVVFGVAKEKDLSKILQLLPKEAYYIFCKADIPRALEAEELYEAATKIGLKGKVVSKVKEAILEAKKLAAIGDLIFIGGSNFVVAEIEEL